MANNSIINIPSTSGDVISDDQITTLNGAGIATGEKVQRMKIAYGAPASATDVNLTTPLPVLANAATAVTSAVTVMQNAVAVTGNGTSLVVTGYGTAVLKISGTFVATINFEFSTDAGTTWDPISATQIGGGDIFTSTTIPGSFRITCTSLDLIRARVTWTSGTSITINGRASNAINATKVVKLASGTNTYGKAFITDGTNSAGITAAGIAGSELTVDRLKVNASLRLLDTAQAAGSQLVAAKGDQTTGLWVNIKNTSIPVTGTFFQATQPISATALPLPTGAAQDGTDITTPFAMPTGGLGIRGWLSSIWTKLNGSLAVTGSFFQATQPVSIATMPSTPVTGTFFQATQPISAAALPLPTGAAQDGTDITTPTAMPTGGIGIRGWLSSIWTKLNGSLSVTGSFFQATQPVSIAAMPTTPVTGTFFQATQPVSLATNTPDVIDRAARLLGVLSTGANTIGSVNIATAQTLATVTTVSAVTAITNALPVGANTIGAVTNANLDVALSTRLKPADTLAAVTLISDTRQTVAANLQATVTQQALTKGTQGTVGVTTQDLKDAGRNQVHYYTIIPVLTTATDTLQLLTGTKGAATVAATATPAVVTTAKTFRVTRLAATYIATAVSGYGIVRLRFQSAGVATITSPIAATLLVGAGAPTTANSTASEEATLDEGWEFAAATGVGISVQGFAAVTPTAVGYILVSLTGYEY